MGDNEKAIESVAQTLKTMIDLRATLRTAEARLRRALRGVQKGEDLSTAIVIAEPATMRKQMLEAFSAVESASHQMRVQVFAAGLDQGMSIGQLGRMFGFSRQLAARYAKEARALV